MGRRIRKALQKDIKMSKSHRRLELLTYYRNWKFMIHRENSSLWDLITFTTVINNFKLFVWDCIQDLPQYSQFFVVVCNVRYGIRDLCKASVVCNWEYILSHPLNTELHRCWFHMLTSIKILLQYISFGKVNFLVRSFHRV